MRYENLLAEVRAKFPKYRVKKRSESILTSWWGANFSTTIGNTTYVEEGFDSWSDDEKAANTKHEATHTEQIHSWPFGPKVPWLNYPIFALCYLLVLPAVWTLRARFEREAYAETAIAQGEMGLLATPEQRAGFASFLAGQFTGSAYFWMWVGGGPLVWAVKLCEDCSRPEARPKSRWAS